jgi:hypothetical protein
MIQEIVLSCFLAFLFLVRQLETHPTISKVADSRVRGNDVP